MDYNKYGIPEQKKFPMPDAAHVRSAIKFFNYADPSYEEGLAKAILRRMKEYGMSFDDFTVGEENRFSKYIPEKALAHHGILGQKWGVRRYQNADGTLTDAGKKRYAKDTSNIYDQMNKTDRLRRKALAKKEKLDKEINYYNPSKRKIYDASQAYKRANRQYKRSLKRGQRMFEAFDKKFGDYRVNDLDTVKIGIGKKLVADALKEL